MLTHAGETEYKHLQTNELLFALENMNKKQVGLLFLGVVFISRGSFLGIWCGAAIYCSSSGDVGACCFTTGVRCCLGTTSRAHEVADLCEGGRCVVRRPPHSTTRLVL